MTLDEHLIRNKSFKNGLTPLDQKRLDYSHHNEIANVSSSVKALGVSSVI